MGDGKRLLKSLYDSSPIFLQSIMLNLYGLRTVGRKKRWEGLIDAFAPTEHWTKAEQIDYVEQRLRIILSHAIRTVPRYRELGSLLPTLDDSHSDVFSVLTEFPVVTRESILSDPASYLSESSRGLQIVRTLTSGTTGTPFETRMDVETFDLSDAFAWRRNLWAGHREGDWIARLVGDPVVPLRQVRPTRPWRTSWLDRRLYLSAYHLNADTAGKYLEILEQRQPAFLAGYPSALAILATFALEMGRRLEWQPKAVLYSSEPMYGHQESVVAQVFKAPIRGFYGSAERIVSAAECEYGASHLSLVDGFVEGQFGILPSSEPALVTTLTNKVMPLIRFQLGDFISTLPNGQCQCGRTLPIIGPLTTKQEDWISTPSGRRISPSILTWALKDANGIRRSQIVQVGRDLVELHVDADEDVFAGLRALLRERLSQMLFGEMTVTVLRDASIEVLSSGKTRFVVRREQPELLERTSETASLPL